MQQTTIDKIHHAVAAIREVAQQDLSGCDVDDIDELIEPVERELHANLPNKQTLSTYLNSLARSVRADAAARNACLQLDEAMREAGIPADWQVR